MHTDMMRDSHEHLKLFGLHFCLALNVLSGAYIKQAEKLVSLVKALFSYLKRKEPWNGIGTPAAVI